MTKLKEDPEKFIRLAQMALALLATGICLEKVSSEMGKAEPDVHFVAKIKETTEADWNNNKEQLIDKLLLEGFRTREPAIKNWKEEAERGLSEDFINDKPMNKDSFEKTDKKLVASMSWFSKDERGWNVLHVDPEDTSANVKRDVITVTKKGSQFAEFVRILQLHCLARALALETCNADLAVPLDPEHLPRFDQMYEATVPNTFSNEKQVPELVQIIKDHGGLTPKELEVMAHYRKGGEEKARALVLLKLAIKRIQKLPILDFSNFFHL